MAAKVSLQKFNQMQRKIESAQKKAKRIRAVADEKVEHLVRSTEIVASGVAAGVVRGKYGRKEIAGVPFELVVGGVLHGAGLMGVGGTMKSHLHAFGDGMLAVFGADLGESIGKKGFQGIRETLLPSGSASTKGLSGATYEVLGGARLTDEELEALTR